MAAHFRFILWGFVVIMGLLRTPLGMASDSSLSFARFDQRARAGEHLSIVFFGGSLTWGAQATNPQMTSYRALISQRFLEKYPEAHFQFWDAAIGGTGSQLGAFRLARDVFSHEPDLVFLDFTVNDDPYAVPSASRLASYESLVRRIIHAGVPVVQVIMPLKADMQPAPPPRLLDPAHKEIGAAYGLPLADIVPFVQAQVAAGKFTPDQLWDTPGDNAHPGDAGYQLYAQVVWQAYLDAVAQDRQCKLPEKMLNGDAFMTVNRHRLGLDAALPKGWSPGHPYRNAITYDFVCSRWMDELAIAAPGAAPLKFQVRASDLLLFGEMTKKGGQYQVRIDGGEPQTFPTKCGDGNMRLVKVIAEGLDPTRDHEIEITPVLNEGEELRLESLCAAGASASVVLAGSNGQAEAHQ